MNLRETENPAPLILIADDDELIRTLISGTLDSNGFETAEVCNGKEAVEAIRELSPDLVVLDIDMPVMDGFTACEKIRKLEAGRDLPVVIITGNEDVGSIERAFEVGATDFISKPVNWSLLSHRMRYILRSAGLRSALAEREAENRAMLKAIPDRVLRLAASGHIIAPPDHSTDSGVGTVRITPRSIAELLPESALATARRSIEKVLLYRSEVSFEYTERPVRQGAMARSFEVRMVPQSEDIVLAILREVTARKQSEARIQELAFYDDLTGLPNRHRFMELAHEFIDAADPDIDKYSLCTINLDRFKRINDTLGHEAGDEILVSVARRLAALKQSFLDRGVRAEVARLGADQFALMAAWSSSKQASDVPVQLMNAFQRPVQCDDQEVLLTASVGIARFPVDGHNVANLLKKAERALFAAKRRGRNQYCGYSGLQEESASDLLMLEGELKKAIERDELRLVFQPRFHMQSGRIVGAEALLRWLHPRHGLMPPGAFIPLAEESGLISEIDRWVIDRVACSLREWQRAGQELAPVSLNLSGREFCFAQPEVTLHSAIARYGIDPSLLEIEITETVMMEEPEAAANTLRQLKAMGIRLAMDDFGTGYSSLGYLKNYPLDVLKIDRAFVKDLQHSTRDQALCRTIIAMAKGLGMECVAEGIETESQRVFLLSEGCDVAQGYALAKPMEEQQYLTMLAGNRRTAPKLELLSPGQTPLS